MVAVVSLSGCEEMFYREVDFTVEGEQEKLVVNSKCEINKYSFFLTVTHSKIATDSRIRPDSLFVNDARVSVRVNSNKWQNLYNTTGRVGYAFPDSADTRKGLVLSPLDTVDIHVTHAVYPPAHVRQVVPGQVNARIVQTTPMQEGWMGIVLEIDPYHGNTDDVIGITIQGGQMLMRHKTSNDTTHLDLGFLYSTDPIFSYLDNIRIESYYGGTGSLHLFLPSSAVQKPLRVSLIADGLWRNQRESRDHYAPVGVSDLKLEVSAHTADSYRYTQYWLNTQVVRINPPYGIPVNNSDFMQEILEEIAGALGGQEPVPAISNVEGGFGCVRLYTTTMVEQH